MGYIFMELRINRENNMTERKIVKRRPSGTLQTIIVNKSSIIDTAPRATFDKVDIKPNTYRFRQLPPSRFVAGRYRTQMIVRSAAMVSLVYGTLKPKKKKK